MKQKDIPAHIDISKDHQAAICKACGKKWASAPGENARVALAKFLMRHWDHSRIKDKGATAEGA